MFYQRKIFTNYVSRFDVFKTVDVSIDSFVFNNNIINYHKII